MPRKMISKRLSLRAPLPFFPAAEDSLSILPVLEGKQPETEPLRRYTLQESIRGFSLRDGSWKYLDHRGSGGNDYG
jgi:arylsulfatase A